ncbi:MAG TPA: DUF503 domain-containing protein [Pseudogracilibacillus sp.]|nr:DUF503 domain-containing protein [Pseudogracilibacillus sp.]
MIVYAEVECFLYDSHSLKEKRSQIRRLTARIRKDFNVAIAELDFHDLWQRTKFGIVTVANELLHAEKVMQQVIEAIDRDIAFERTVTVIERV